MSLPEPAGASSRAAHWLIARSPRFTVRVALARILIVILFLVTEIGQAQSQDTVPTDLDGLVRLAVERHPEHRALLHDAAAATASARAGLKPMDPQWMVEALAIGAMPDAPDPTMFMVGFTQMLELPGVYRSRSERATLVGEWAETDQGRLAADLRLELAQTAARLAASTEEVALLEQQIVIAEALLAEGMARYGAGAGISPSMSNAGMSSTSASAGANSGPGAVGLPQPAPPNGGAGMAGMSAASAGSMGAATSAGSMSGGQMGATGSLGMGAGVMDGGGSMGAMGKSGPMGGGASMGGNGPALASLLRLDAEISRIKADRAVLLARRDGTVAVLAVVVGEEASLAVASEPERFLASPSHEPPPELRLSRVGTRSAEVNLAVERSERRPDLMVGAGVRIMPEGMFAGTDVAVGVSFPLYGGSAARITAAETQVQASAERQRAVERQLVLAAASAEAALAAALAWSQALDQAVVPRTRAALDATQALYAAGGAGLEDVLRSWQAALEVEREAVNARLDIRLRAADLARVEIP